jgi:hypothetical protein
MPDRASISPATFLPFSPFYGSGQGRPRHVGSLSGTRSQTHSYRKERKEERSDRKLSKLQIDKYQFPSFPFLSSFLGVEGA